MTNKFKKTNKKSSYHRLNEYFQNICYILVFQSHSAVNDIFECYLQQIEFTDFRHATPMDLHNIMVSYVDANRELITVCITQKFLLTL